MRGRTRECDSPSGGTTTGGGAVCHILARLTRDVTRLRMLSTHELFSLLSPRQLNLLSDVTFGGSARDSQTYV